MFVRENLLELDKIRQFYYNWNSINRAINFVKIIKDTNSFLNIYRTTFSKISDPFIHFDQTIFKRRSNERNEKFINSQIQPVPELYLNKHSNDKRDTTATAIPFFLETLPRVRLPRCSVSFFSFFLSPPPSLSFRETQPAPFV